MNKGPITHNNAVMFLRARHITAHGRDHEAEERDIASQRIYCQAKADQLHAIVVKEYVEYGGTGPIAHRPIMRQMLGELRTLLGVRYILVVSLDRLARKPEDVRALEQEIHVAGARLVEASSLAVAAYFCSPDESHWDLTVTE